MANDYEPPDSGRIAERLLAAFQRGTDQIRDDIKELRESHQQAREEIVRLQERLKKQEAIEIELRQHAQRIDALEKGKIKERGILAGGAAVLGGMAGYLAKYWPWGSG